ncbi:phage antirepressor Ant [Pseudohalocynthiibacter aestuariivivens]|nr:BRO family protein [Pseudohalocynthiibacter aestuariivivens]QIE45324.1 phage antirepressor Ant [Pseudohalocynthiibacter aestuariivivens]
MNAITKIISETQSFDFNAKQVRVVNRDGSPWFVAKDVCDVLGLTNSRKTVAALDEDERDILTSSNVTAGYISAPNRGLNIISESGLYSLIFQSRKAEAKAFRKWVTSTVLPAIRKTGSYVAGEEHLDPTAPDYMERLHELLLEAKERKIAAQAAEIEALTPKADDHDKRFERVDLVGLTEYAKQVGLRPNKFCKVLRQMGYLYSRGRAANMPSAHYADKFFERRDTVAGFGQTMLTEEGVIHFNGLLNAGVFDGIKTKAIAA